MVNLNCDSPYMLLVANVNKDKCIEMTKEQKLLFGIDKLNKNSVIPAVTHVDYSARIQTVHKSTNIDYYNLLSEFKKIAGCPILVNTSFNVRGSQLYVHQKMLLGALWVSLDVLVIESHTL